MRRFRLIEHTADTGLIACGKSLNEAFANSAYGMFSIMVDMRTVRLKEARKIDIKEKDPERLLVAWLNELVYRFDVERILFRQFEVYKLDGVSLAARCTGEKIDPLRHRIKIGIKSATYHMLGVDSGKNEVRVIFDV